MKKQTQRKWVEEQLKVNGEITRNQCLSHYISRLSAIIQDLEASGYVFTTSNREGDYVYTVANRPTRKEWRHRIENGVAIPYQVTIEL